MSQTLPGLVADSANLGIVSIKDNTIAIQVFARSAQDEKLEEFKIYAGVLADLSGFALQIDGQGPGWAEKKDSKLLPVITKVFEEQNGKPMTVAIIHAGLECGWFCRKNPNLDIVSIGVTNIDIHSCRERIELATIVPQVNLIKETLTRLKNI
jgi:dipeptidase D